jgi:hypothetical protein
MEYNTLRGNDYKQASFTQEHFGESVVGCVEEQKTYDLPLGTDVLPTDPPTFVRQNAFYPTWHSIEDADDYVDLFPQVRPALSAAAAARKAAAKRERKKKKMKKHRNEAKDRDILVSEQRSLKEERRTEDFLVGYNGKNETKAIKNNTPRYVTEGGLGEYYKQIVQDVYSKLHPAHFPADYGTLWEDEKFTEYDDYERHLIFVAHGMGHCSRYGTDEEALQAATGRYSKGFFESAHESLLYFVDLICTMLPIERFKTAISAVREVLYDFLQGIDFVGIWESIKGFTQSLIEYLKEHLLQTIVLIISIAFARSRAEICFAFVAFAVARGIDTHFFRIIDMIPSFSEIVSEGASEFLDFARSVIERTYKSELVGAIKHLILLGVSCKLFPLLSRKTTEMLLGKPEKMSLVDMLCASLGAVSKLFKYGDLIWSGKGTLSSVFMSDDPISDFISRATLHLRRSDFVYDGLPVGKNNETLQGWKCRKEYLAYIEKDLLPAGKKIKSELPSKDDRKRTVDNLIYTLEEQMMIQKAAQRRKNRMPPFGLIVHGPSKIGKSHLVKLFPAIYSAVKGRDFDESQIFNKPKTSDYWDGYSPYLHHYVFVSELANESEAMIMKSDKNDLTMMQSLCDGLPFVCDMSSVNDKGKTWFDSDMVIADTNVPHLHAKKLCAYPAAQYRRYLFVGVSVKPKFRAWVTNEQGKMVQTTSLDTKESLNAGGNLLDRYDFTVKQYEAIDAKPIAKVIFTGGVEDLVKFLIPVFKTHIANNERVRETDLYSFVKDIYSMQNGEPNRNSVEIKEDLYSNTEYPFANLVPEELDEKEYVAPDGPVYVTQGGVIDTIRSYMCVYGIPEDAPMLEIKKRPYLTYISYEVLSFVWSLITIILTWLFDVFLFNEERISRFVRFPAVFVMSFLITIYYHNAATAMFLIVVLLLRYMPRLIVRFVAVEVRDGLASEKDKAWHKAWKTLGWNPDRFSWEINPTHLKLVGLLAFAAGTIGVAVKLYKSSKKYITSEGNKSTFYTESVHNEELLDFEEKMNCSNEGRLRIKTHDGSHYNTMVLQPEIAKYQGTPKDLHDIVETNIRTFRVVDKGDSGYQAVAFLFGIKSHYAITSYHLIQDMENFTIEIGSDNRLTSDTRTYTIDMTQRMVHYIGNDVCLLYLDPILFRDVSCHLYSGPSFTLISGYIHGFTPILARVGEMVMHDTRLKGIKVDGPYGYEIDHFPGLCGYPLCAMTNRSASAIVGIHCAGDLNSKHAFAAPIDREAILIGIDALSRCVPYMNIMSQGLIELPMQIPVTKSPFWYEYLPYLTYYGRIEGSIVLPDKSHLKASPYYAEVSQMLNEEFKFEPTVLYGKPLFKPRMIDGEYVSPYNKALRKMDKTAPTPNYVVLQKSIDYYVRHIVDGLRSRGVERLGPITIKEAINGVDDDPFISRINMSTSAAFGFAGTKAKHFPIVQDLPLIREPTDEVKKRLALAMKRYLRGEMCNFVFKSQLKDEPRELAKCADGSTRVFFMSPIDCLVLSRNFLSPLYSRMVEFSDVFGVAIGYDMHRVAGRLATEMHEFSEKILEFDYAGFDVANPLFIAKGAATVIYRVLEEFGYSEFSLKMLSGILSDAIFPMVCMNQDLFSKGGLQPSGKYGTAEDNSLRGMLMLIYAWYSTPELADLDFFTYVKPIVYGDDALVSVKEEVITYFNNLTYRDFCAKHYLMKVTPAAKNDEFEPYLSIRDVSFLKRSFVRHFTDHIVGQLDMNSINKSFQWIMPSAAVPEGMQVHSSFQSMLWELFFHCTSEEQFFRIRERLLQVLITHYGGERSHYALPTFEMIRETVF